MTLGGPLKYSLVSLCSLLLIFFASCGGGNMGGSSGTDSTDLTGNWQIQLSYAESSDVGGSAPDGNTVIKIPLSQAAKGSSVLSSSGQAYGDDVGCNGMAGNFWSMQGGFNPVVFFQSGQVQNKTLSLVVQVSQQATPPSNTAHGQLMFTGMVNADGSLSGTVTDQCDVSNGQLKQGTWTAHQISSIP